MKCPRCGAEMTMDEHRKYGLYMCYECGYMEGRNFGELKKKETNFEHLKALNINELTAFVSAGLGIDEKKLFAWLDSPVK